MKCGRGRIICTAEPHNYRRVPKFSPYGSVSCACAQWPGSPRQSFLRTLRSQKHKMNSMGPKLRHLVVRTIHAKHDCKHGATQSTYKRVRSMVYVHSNRCSRSMLSCPNTSGNRFATVRRKPIRSSALRTRPCCLPGYMSPN